MSPVAKKLSEVLNHEIDLIDSLDSSDIFNTTQIQLLENLDAYQLKETMKASNKLANKGMFIYLMLWDCSQTGFRTQLFNKQSFMCWLLLERD